MRHWKDLFSLSYYLLLNKLVILPLSFQQSSSYEGKQMVKTFKQNSIFEGKFSTCSISPLSIHGISHGSCKVQSKGGY